MTRGNALKSRLQPWSASLLGLFLTLLAACDYRPRVSIQGGTVPTFNLTGHGSIDVITISGPDFGNPKTGDAGSRYMKPFWQIAPVSDYDVRRLANSGGLVYGKVPDGFRQVIPDNGAAPPPLLENEIFTFDLRVTNSSGVGVRFVVHNGKAVLEGS